jgi:hypothetical protein
MSARLAVDRYGRQIAIGTLLDIRGLRWIVLDWREMFEPPGRSPSARERESARAPFNAPAPLLQPPKTEVPDELLDDRAAIAAAYREQRREPLHLVSAA